MHPTTDYPARSSQGRLRDMARAALTVGLTVPLVLGGAGPASSRTSVDAPQGAPTGTWPTYPEPGRGTDVVDHAEKLEGFAEPAWYEANVPFVDIPDAEIEDTYYYRWRTYKEALKDTGAEDGWIVSEFLGPVGYSAPNGGIVAAAGHHLYEGRWLRDQRYLDDYVDYWLTGSGSGPKPATDALNENTTDWSHQYSFWVADAVLARAAVDGRAEEATELLPELEEQWQGWAPQFSSDLGLYWQTPVWDAMEYTASSYQSDDPYHGGDGFRPTLNAYQFGDAQAIAELARLAGDYATAQRYEAAATDLQQAQERWLWDEEDGFYKHVMRDDNADRTQLEDREQIGFVPWYFGMAPPENARAWAQLTDPQGFAARFGPTTVERRSPWFMHEALQGCCRWDGPSWPYSTSQTLTAMANLLIEQPEQPYVDAGDYYDVLRSYALTQRKDGKPYVAEAHHPDEDRWLYDGRNHSEDYNHSTFNDLVLSGLLGIRPQTGDSVRVAPLASADWDHWAVENIAYHGRNLSVVWDADGSAYDRGKGLSVFLDGRRVHRQADLEPVEVAVPPAASTPADRLPELVDDLVDVDGNGPQVATAFYTGAVDSPANAIDGQDFHLDVPNTRWTTYGSPNGTDWLEVDLGAPTEFSDVSVVFYDDGGGVRTPATYELQHRTAGGRWAALPGQHRSPAQPTGRVVNRVTLEEPVRTDALRLVVTPQPGTGVGVTAMRALREEDPMSSWPSRISTRRAKSASGRVRPWRWPPPPPPRSGRPCSTSGCSCPRGGASSTSAGTARSPSDRGSPSARRGG